MECDDAPILVNEEYPPFRKLASLNRQETGENGAADGAEIEAD